MKSGANLRLVSGKLTIKIRQFMVVQPPKKHPWRPSTLEDPPKPTQPGPGVHWFIYFWHLEGIFISFPRNSWHIPSSDHSPSPCYDTFSASKKSGHSLWEFGGKHVTSNFHTTQLLDFETQSEILLDQSPSVQIVCSNTAYPRVAWKKNEISHTPSMIFPHKIQMILSGFGSFKVGVLKHEPSQCFTKTYPIGSM